MKEGSVFDLLPMKAKDANGKKIIIPVEKQFSEKWMAKVDAHIAVTSGPDEDGDETGGPVVSKSRNRRSAPEPSNQDEVI